MENVLGTSSPFLLKSKTYTVTGKESWDSTQTTATVREVYHGFGTSNQVSASVQSTHHDRLYLEDGKGNLHDVELTNWDIGIAKGHEITIVWPMNMEPDDKPKPLVGIWVTVKEKHNMGNVLAIKNHQTGQVRMNEQLMRAMARNPWMLVIPVAAILLFFILKTWMIKDAGIGSFLFAALLGALIWQKTWNPQRYRQLKLLVGNMLD